MPVEKEKAPETARYIVDRPIYHTPGQRPHAVGAEVTMEIDQAAHLVAAGFLHRVGGEPAAIAVAAGQQLISQPAGQQTVAPPMPAAPLPQPAKNPAT